MEYSIKWAIVHNLLTHAFVVHFLCRNVQDFRAGIVIVPEECTGHRWVRI